MYHVQKTSSLCWFAGKKPSQDSISGNYSAKLADPFDKTALGSTMALGWSFSRAT